MIADLIVIKMVQPGPSAAGHCCLFATCNDKSMPNPVVNVM